MQSMLFSNTVQRLKQFLWLLLQIMMKLGPAIACCVIYLSLLLTSVAGTANYKLAGDGTAIRTDFVPTTVTTRAWDGSLGDEPSCDELRAMWRFSKRQSRATQIHNEIPTYRDPFAYNVWEPYARSRSVGGRGRGAGSKVYGRIVYTAPRSSSRDHPQERFRPSEEVAARLIGTGYQGTFTGIPRRKGTSFRSGATSQPDDHLPHYAQQVGSKFEMVKDLIRKEKARELQEERMADEAAARAAAIRGQMSDSSYGQILHEPPTHPHFEALRYGNPGYFDENMHLSPRNGRMLTLHDPMASTATQYADRDVHLYNHRSYPDMIPVSDINTVPSR